MQDGGSTKKQPLVCLPAPMLLLSVFAVTLSNRKVILQYRAYAMSLLLMLALNEPTSLYDMSW